MWRLAIRIVVASVAVVLSVRSTCHCPTLVATALGGVWGVMRGRGGERVLGECVCVGGVMLG